MRMSNYELRIDHKITGNFPEYGIIFYGYGLTDENSQNKSFLVTKKGKNKLLLFNPTYEQTIELRKEDLRKFVDDLSAEYPNVVFVVAIKKKED